MEHGSTISPILTQILQPLWHTLPFQLSLLSPSREYSQGTHRLARDQHTSNRRLLAVHAADHFEVPQAPSRSSRPPSLLTSPVTSAPTDVDHPRRRGRPPLLAPSIIHPRARLDGPRP